MNPFVPLLIGLRYTRAKRRNHYVSFVSLASMLGISLGIAVLITVLSVMNGFDQQIHQQIFSMAKQLSISRIGSPIRNSEQLQQFMQQHPQVMHTAPVTAKESLITAKGQVQASYVYGIEPGSYNNISQIKKKIILGSLNTLQPGVFHIILGRQLAGSLGVGVGDTITVVTPEASLSILGMLPRFKAFKVGAIFSSDGTEYDRALAFIHLKDAQTLYHLNHAVTEVHAKLKDLYQAPQVARDFATTLDPSFNIRDWTFDYGSLFDAIKLEKKMMFIILSLIIAVAAFNLVSSLVMMVTDKKADIAILRTLGATKKTIMAVFMVQGLTVGFVGILAGVILGILLALNVSDIVSFVERIFQVKFVSSSIYYVDYLPSELHLADVLKITGASILMCLVATLYPAWRAASQDPAEALRYE